MLDVIVPVADRDRMLLAAEKCVELQITSWRPVYFARSRSVTPRGEGTKFREKVKARMESALEQTGGAWMPDIHEERDAADALKAFPSDWTRLLLDAGGAPLAALAHNGPMGLAVGPEGGLEQREVADAQELGWLTASLGETTLRFETAIIAGAAVIRAAQLSLRSH
jgi:16S rRNA (uracil1498-N3)-methyltransferase